MILAQDEQSSKPALGMQLPPEAIRSLPAWLVWKLERHVGEAKPRKVPWYVSGGRRHGIQGSPDDRLQLVTFHEARAAQVARGFDGVGFCPLPEWGVVALDFDNCVVGGKVHAEVARVVAGTYAEFSPSGKGVRAFVRGNLGDRKDNRPDQPFGVELFSTKGFTTYTGRPLEVVELTDTANTIVAAGPELIELCTARFGPAEPSSGGASASAALPLGLTADQLVAALGALPQDLDYDAWLRVGMALHHETAGEGFELWDSWSSRSPKYSTRDYGLMKWESFGKGGQAPTTAQALVRLANAHGAGIDLAAVEAADDFEVIASAPTAPPKPLKFPGTWAHDFGQQPLPVWIVHGVIPKAGVVMLVGESGAGKSFVALDVGAAISRGIEWRGRRVRQGRVVYVAAEGAGGFRKRIRAYELKHAVALDRMAVIPAAPNLLLRDDALEVCRSIEAMGGADLVIVDTLAQTTPGADENGGKDMSRALEHCKDIHKATGATVLLVHHHGKDVSKGARGWSGLKGAMDAEIEVLRTAVGRSLRVSKQKDGEDGLSWGFELHPITIGEDSDGDPITSCVVVEAELPAVHQVGQSLRKLGPIEAKVVEVINEIAQSQTSGIEVDFVIAEVARRRPAPADGKRDLRKQHVRQAFERLCALDNSPYLVDDSDNTLSIL